jgi:fumarylacetoacetase
MTTSQDPLRPGSADDPFGIHNLAYAVATIGADPRPRVVVRLGDYALDLSTAAATLLPRRAELFRADLFGGGTLNPLLAAGHLAWVEVREQLTQWLSDPSPVLQSLIYPLHQLHFRLAF